MATYRLTVFEKNGEKTLEESFQANDDAAAKELGTKMLEEKKFLDKTHRCTSPAGKLLLFHS
ncbi:MAG: YhzD family protein [Bacillota bacterium]|nr:YhzD family protein [Bacillota bacterium]